MSLVKLKTIKLPMTEEEHRLLHESVKGVYGNITNFLREVVGARISGQLGPMAIEPSPNYPLDIDEAKTYKRQGSIIPYSGTEVMLELSKGVLREEFTEV
jgi:hypothetical protein